MDFKQHFNNLEERGRQLFGHNFQISPADHDILKKLIAYFLCSAEQTSHFQISLQKGILLTGPVGVGKTSFMTLMRFLLSKQQCFMIKSCREVTFEFIKEGYLVIQKYSTYSFARSYPIEYDPRKPITYCFDDLGTESSLKYYGNTCNVLGEILLSRYDHFISNNMITHATTNLSASELETLYGNRVRSRMREMFNLLSFEKGAEDKRK